MYKNYLKRPIDLILSLIAFILVSPIFLLVTLLLTVANKGKAFFFQARPGKDEKIFKVIKFKTMTDEKGSNRELLPDAERLTALGTFVRKTSLDEIPQLLNVIKGDMSLIGPRPLLVQYLPHYNQQQKQRHNVRPGITGWAQVNGRNSSLFSKRFDNDVWYVNNISFLLDLKIILLTIKNVILSQGNIPGQNVMDVDDLGFNK